MMCRGSMSNRSNAAVGRARSRCVASRQLFAIAALLAGTTTGACKVDDGDYAFGATGGSDTGSGAGGASADDAKDGGAAGAFDVDPGSAGNSGSGGDSRGAGGAGMASGAPTE